MWSVSILIASLAVGTLTSLSRMLVQWWIQEMQSGATAPPPLHDENSAWRPIFSEKGAPYPDPNAPFFVFRSEPGKHMNEGVIQLKNQRIFLNKSPKISARLRRAYFSLYFSRPLCKLPPPLQLRAGSAPVLVLLNCSCYITKSTLNERANEHNDIFIYLDYFTF